MQIPKYVEQISRETRRRGYNPIVGEHWIQEQKWLQWYRGAVNDFHFYRRYVNGKAKQYEMLGLNMAKKVAEDWTGLLWNNHCRITVNDPILQNRLDDVLRMNNFDVAFTNLLEKTFALGNGFIIAYVAEGETRLDFITLTNAMVVSTDNGRITGVLTVDAFQEDEGKETAYYTHLTYHTAQDGQYRIEHYVYKSKEKNNLGKSRPEYITKVFNEAESTSMRYIDEYGDIRYAVTYDTPRPFFAHIKPNITNNFDIDSPLGISVFANVIDTLKSIDTKFNATEREVVQNKTRIMLNSEWLKVKAEDNEQTGEMSFIKYYDDNDDAIIGIPTQDSEKLMEFYQGQFRLDPLEMSLQRDINRLAHSVGLGKDYYDFVDGFVYQNEKSVVHGNSQTWRNKVKHELVLREALIDIAHAILFLEMVSGNIPTTDLDALEMEVHFDDSIVQDDETMYQKLLQLAQAGFIPRYKVIQHALSVSEEEARAMTGETEEVPIQGVLEEMPETVDPEEESEMVDIGA